jgi:hypothetical protein
MVEKKDLNLYSLRPKPRKLSETGRPLGSWAGFECHKPTDPEESPVIVEEKT